MYDEVKNLTQDQLLREPRPNPLADLRKRQYEEAMAVRAAARKAAENEPPPPEETPVPRSSSSSRTRSSLGNLTPVYLSPWIPLMANAGPRAADYAQRANFGLDPRGSPLVGPGVGGYASPRETDNAASVFLDNTRMDRQEAANAARIQFARMAAMQQAERQRQEALMARLAQYQ